MTAAPVHRDRFPDTAEAASLILPHLFDVAGTFDTAVDVGGGTGAWCAALKRFGLGRVSCVDHPDVGADELLVDWSEFIPSDLSRDFPAPLRSDLVLCLEVAEHLPPDRSEPLVDFLTSSGNVVLFSAAIPGQPSPYHLNEQPAEFWRGLFSRRGFRRFDCLRPRIVADDRIPYWYRQNLYLFATDEEANRRHLRSLPFAEIPPEFEVVHSRVLHQYRTAARSKVRDVPAIVGRSLRARLRRS